MKQFYVGRKFTPASLQQIALIDKIMASYQAQGFTLTVRQLYYQLVARNVIPNNERSYKNTTSLVNDARLAGLLDWDLIEDRTREFIDRPHWSTGKDFLQSVAPQFFVDMWANQARRVFVVVEKEALAGVLERACHKYDVPLLAARGYPSVSVVRDFAIHRIMPNVEEGQSVRVIHLGDHDPSGLDMTGDLERRLNLLSEGTEFELNRIALNRDQVDEYNLPPNPAKLTDARSKAYVKRHGRESWELDALEPKQIVELTESWISNDIDPDLWEERLQFVKDTREKLVRIAGRYDKLDRKRKSK